MHGISAATEAGSCCGKLDNAHTETHDPTDPPRDVINNDTLISAKSIFLRAFYSVFSFPSDLQLWSCDDIFTEKSVCVQPANHASGCVIGRIGLTSLHLLLLLHGISDTFNKVIV